MTPTRRPLRSRPRRAARTTAAMPRGASAREVESSGSWEAMTSWSRAASSTVRAMGPGVSREEAMAMTPKRETVP